ncbi:MAG: molecular chaperone TorD family protein, partial [Raoultibacter sp.]
IMCGFCARLFEESPEPEFIRGLVENRHLLLEAPFADVAGQAARDLFDVLDAVAGASSEELDAFITEVRRDYTYLFYMVGSSHTSPYESVYRTDDRTLFGPTTLEVRSCYRAQGVQTTEEGSRPDDHIASELSFLEFLCEKPDESGVIQSFLSDHVLVFAPTYLKNVQTRAQEPFYRNVAAIAEALLDAMAEDYGAHPAEIIDPQAYLLSGNTI